MDLYLISHGRRRPAPLGVAVVAIVGMIIWAFTAQGRAAAATADCPAETACKLDTVHALAIEDSDLRDDVDANGGGDDDESGDDDTSGGAGGGGGGQSDSGGDSSGDGGSDGSGGGGGGQSDSGGDSSGDGGSGGSSDGGTTAVNTPPPGGNTPPPGGNTGANTPPGGAVLAGSGGPPVSVLPNTAVPVDGAVSSGLIAGLLTLAAACATGVRRVVRAPATDR